MTEELNRTIVSTYLKQLRLTRMASDCEALAREAEQRGLGYLGYEAHLTRRRGGSSKGTAAAPTAQSCCLPLSETLGGL
jgi:hypothetical protein